MNYDAGKYDVAVIGAGHAGIEAALAAARLGVSTVVFTIKSVLNFKNPIIKRGIFIIRVPIPTGIKLATLLITSAIPTTPPDTTSLGSIKTDIATA